jgi:Flp pilus assembly protein TadB
MESVRERSLSDRRALIMSWVVVVVSAVIAIWGRSIILGVFSVLALTVASSWTYTRRRTRKEY